MKCDQNLFGKTILKKIFISNDCFNISEVNLNIAFGISENFARPLGVMITSILENNLDLKFAVHIFINKIDKKDVQRFKDVVNKYNVIIIIYYIDDTIFSKLNTAKFTIAAYYRFLIPMELSRFTNKILYLDADMVCVGKINPLLDIDFEDKIACVVKDEAVVDVSHLNLVGHNYFNSGMLYINIEKWNKEMISEQCIELLNSHSYDFACFDQDALNIIMECKVKYISSKFNFLCNLSISSCKNIVSVPEQTIFIHYIGFNKPWHKWCFHPLASYFRNFANKSLWKEVPLDSIPKKYREMKMLAKFYFKNRKYLNAIYWFIKYGIYKIKNSI